MQTLFIVMTIRQRKNNLILSISKIIMSLI